MVGKFSADELAERNEVAVLAEVERGYRLRFLPPSSESLRWVSFVGSYMGRASFHTCLSM